MSDNNQEYDDFYYDDGRFSDEGGYEEEDDFDIPTYDELDIEGRYYTYGSREEYNAWRNKEIQALSASSQQKSHKDIINNRHNSDEFNASNVKPYSKLTKKEKTKYSSREDYNNWRKDFIRQKLEEITQKNNKSKELRSKQKKWVAFIIFIEILIFAYFLVSIFR